MLVNLNIDEHLLEPMIKEHLEVGTSVQTYILNAISYYSKAKGLTKEGFTIGASKNDYHLKGADCKTLAIKTPKVAKSSDDIESDI